MKKAFKIKKNIRQRLCMELGHTISELETFVWNLDDL